MAKEDKEKLKGKWDNNTHKRSPDAPKQVHERTHSSERIFLTQKKDTKTVSGEAGT